MIDINAIIKEAIKTTEAQINEKQGHLQHLVSIYNTFNTHSAPIDILPIDDNHKELLRGAGIERIKQFEIVLNYFPEQLMKIKGIGTVTVKGWQDDVNRR